MIVNIQNGIKHAQRTTNLDSIDYHRIAGNLKPGRVDLHRHRNGIADQKGLTVPNIEDLAVLHAEHPPDKLVHEILVDRILGRIGSSRLLPGEIGRIRCVEPPFVFETRFQIRMVDRIGPHPLNGYPGGRITGLSCVHIGQIVPSCRNPDVRPGRSIERLRAAGKLGITDEQEVNQPGQVADIDHPVRAAVDIGLSPVQRGRIGYIQIVNQPGEVADIHQVGVITVDIADSALTAAAVCISNTVNVRDRGLTDTKNRDY